MKYTILMLIYNTKIHDFINIIECIKKQTFKHFNLLIYNDGSLNNDEYLNVLKESNIRYKYIYNKNNIGICAARDYIFTKYQKFLNEYIITIDSDDLIKSDFMQNINSQINGNNYDLIFLKSFSTFRNDESSQWYGRKINFPGVLLDDRIITKIYKNFIKDFMLNTRISFSNFKSINEKKEYRFILFAFLTICGPNSIILNKKILKFVNYQFENSSDKNFDFKVVFDLIDKIDNVLFIDGDKYIYQLNSFSSCSKNFDIKSIYRNIEKIFIEKLNLNVDNKNLYNAFFIYYLFVIYSFNINIKKNIKFKVKLINPTKLEKLAYFFFI